MTDTKPDNTSDSGSATAHDKPNQKKVAAPTGARVAKSSRRSSIVVAILILLLIVAALAAMVWYQHRVMHERVDTLLGQAQQSSREAQAASGQAMQAFGLARQQQQKIEQMAGELESAQQHLQSLEQALQMMTDSGADIALINDMDHLVSIAHQQLLLGGNVSNAIIALETAQAQLARANRPSLASLQQAINGDVERLRAVSTIDINRLSSRIDELGRLIESAPLLIPDDAAPALAPSPAATRQNSAPAPKAVDPSAPWWKQSMSSAAEWSRHTWFNIKQDLAGFISVRRVDDAAALLMSPEQAGSLRDKLRLRLMTAQLALLMKQPDVWATETRAVVQLLQARYDINSVEGHRALRLALQLADTSIKLELPTVANSQSAIQSLREEIAKSAQTGLNDAETDEQAPSQSTEQGATNGGDTDGPTEAPAEDEAAPEPEAQDSPGSAAPTEGATGSDPQGVGELVNGADSGEAETPVPSTESTPAATSAGAGVRIAMAGV
ncbi:uroporphyrinogen-III C-methyltransferase [Pusillimonas sp.]|uniref:uroporphyrinogen-III C-methyltransferase n=1 Tax=Pusillimonas sp. TaxID=3040095 RepID=UPI0037C6FE9D